MKNNTGISNGVKKLGTYLFYVGALVFAIALVWISVSPNKKIQSSDFNSNKEEKNSQKTGAQESKPAEKVQLFVFHSTNRCHSCITMGLYAKVAVEEFFQPELKSGKVEFREINVDLPENKKIA